ncbi:excinuclease ABC subunit B [Desulfobacter hydrogenophilus]|uniref:UvrABC system protein B n=1 Tax=Desulfobacter hydrogenophilus TaxID=2291 RepID=A0A328FAW6_9BACT|nr:excinuclease ABC subunit UvrB [Desulfobacter hydrogenophilus]NDY72392.1 excinuclease ABC subunit UvrB [Desulfobacter hydrogenophilus]QBH13118.1 excinuclease ABC subunit UvrB [Desulfobacter hydrogenophilus]RAM01824.1 excinuclease ABC subunit B [Desulfobacter hydrogenophilus]
MGLFNLVSPYGPAGDQPKAIDYLVRGVKADEKYQVLLGVTGSGKTFTMASIISQVEKPSLIIAPNKTLAAQLYNEFKMLFPDNCVEYFVSYYDYYQPEAYIPSSDTYIQKDSSINELIDKMRHSATRSVLARKDVIVVASVSCIYGLGAPEEYLDLRVTLDRDMEISREDVIRKFVDIQYTRNDVDFHRGTFRVRGDRLEIFPAYEENKAVRIDFFGDTIEEISEIDALKGTVIKQFDQMAIYPASHYVTNKKTRKQAVERIVIELKERLAFLNDQNMLVEAQRLEERTRYDLEMLEEIGYCNGIENYSRHLTGRAPGQPPPTLLDYIDQDFLLFFDESHISVSQLGAMYKADRSRKETLVKHGFRLPSAVDNRPLKFEEFKGLVPRTIFVSATPGDYELEKAGVRVAEQIVRPTGLLDPPVEIRDARMQVDDLYQEILKRVEAQERVLVTTLTKRMSEDLTDYYSDLGIKVKYLHSDIGTVERIDIIQDLRRGLFDVLIGINLLREGLDIPEVTLVAILDADKEGFLRSFRSFIQIFGRAARNANGRVIMYAEKETGSMKHALSETRRRRKIQEAYNQAHGITPATISKKISAFDYTMADMNANSVEAAVNEELKAYDADELNLDDVIRDLEAKMNEAAETLEFEQAAQYRDKIRELKKIKTAQP